MNHLEHMLKMAEDELTEYSTDARKMEKLRRKIGLAIPREQQKICRETLAAQMASSGLQKLVEQQRQTIALPFWGIAGLGLLGGISLAQWLGYVMAVAGTIAAYRIQKWGWELQAKRLLLQTLDDIEARIAQPN
ncbi:MAG TPA: hypothetical protein DEA78_12255 [Cyanobacteria bacterium UBA11159]|nr:hypothetical protein [Cyanobacteria bacterium UBA11366]HBK61940.1 hypothetical protein [Cyanobacteria bacterium UBA11166]HBR74457.1 hypothetical protein [Cyanobacteria bacterium UBA11159]HBS70049.1 hypothetical protein [Cyanobacteria bacterium UBA11153]HCA96997.1 hypothetical protein [Cyanobacteria bacterium UBA9226]